MIATALKKTALAGLIVLASLLIVQGAQAAVTITRTSSPVFYSDITNGLTDGYVAYRITTTTAVADAWAQIGNFSGLNISLGTHEDGLYHLGPMAAGSSKMVYFYLHTAANFVGSESHVVSLYNGKPPGGIFQGNQTFSLSQEDTIQASASKVTSVITGPTPATLGGIVTMVVTGDTGTTNGPMAFTPASDSTWLADTYELFTSTFTLPNGTVLNDQPYVATYNGITGTYVAVYQFVAKGSASAPSAGSPANYIQSGQQLKHTPTGSSAGNPSMPPIDPTTGNATVVTKFADKTILPPGSGGTATYTLRFTNNGSIDVTLDDIADTLPSTPAAASYMSGTAKFNGVAITNPSISGAQLTWSGAFVIPALSYRDLTFQATVPGTAGTYLNSAIAHIGATQIDTTVTTTDNAPATYAINVSTAPSLTKTFAPSVIGTAQQSLLAFTITNGQGNPAQSNLGFVDTFPANITVVGIVSNTCGGTVNWNAGSITLSGGAMTAGTASCAIAATVTSSVAGSYLNKYDVNPALSNISGLAGGLDASGLNATLQVSSATLTKIFNPSNINANQDTDVAFTITNGLGNPAQSGLGFTETLASGLVVVTPPLVSTTCGGSVYKVGTTSPLTGGETGFSFSGGALAAGTSSCTVTVAVKPPSNAPAGTTYSNSSSNVTNITPPGLVSNVTNQTLTIVGTPTLEKGFNPTTVGVGQPSTLTFTINNPSNQKQQNLSFTDLFPGGLIVATPPNVTSTCGGNVYRTGTTTALSGGEAALDFIGGALAANTASCTITVRVTSLTAAAYTNGGANITSLSGLANGVSPRTLNVVGTTLGKTFGAPSIITGGTTSMTFTVTNGTGDPAQAGFGFSDQLPAGLTVTGTPASPQCGGTVSYNAGSNTLSLSGSTLTLGTHSCTIAATVTSSTPGTYTNSSSNIISSAGGLNTSGLTATLVVGNAPTITVTKALIAPGRVAAADQFTVQIRNSSGTVLGSTANSTTAGAGTIVTPSTGTSSYTASSLGVSYNLTEVMAGGSSSTLAQYLTSLSCTNNSVAVPGLTSLGQSFTPVAGDNYACTISNTPAPTIRVTKALTASGRAVVSDQFTVQIKDNTGALVGSSTNSTTTGSGATVTAGSGTSSYTAVALGGIYNLNEVMAGGSGSPLTQYLSAISCTNNGSAVPGLTSLGQNFTPAAGDNYACTITNTPQPATITIVKSLLPTSDPGTFNLLAGATTVASGVGNGGTGSATVPANIAVTISETGAGGTSLGDYTSAYSCTGGITGSGASVTITPAAGQAITCTFTNTRNGVNVSGFVYSDTNHDGTMNGSDAGTGQSLFVKLSPYNGATCANPATAYATANPASGTYTLPTITPGDYCLILDNNSNLADTTSTNPGGWIGVETGSGMRTITVGSIPLAARNFGLYNGSRLSGKVFSDTGVGGGAANDGVQNGTEQGLTGVAVRVTDNATTYDSTVTDGSGDYTLWIPAAAGSNSLKVVETNLSGYASTGGNAGTTGGSYDLASDATAFTNTVGTIYSGVTFADVPANTFTANTSRSVAAGGVVFYPHTFTAGTGGTVSFTTSAVANPAISGWSEVLYLDSNCNGAIDAGELQISGAITTTAGQQVCILVKEFSPTNAPTNAANSVTVTATFTYADSTLPPAALTLTDLTTVVQSGLTLMKYVDKASALPGDTLTYTITYLNSGFSQLTNIVISDSVPTYTNSPSACCVNPTSGCMGAPPTSYPSSITGCTIVTTSSSVSWILVGTLNPGSSGQVKFSVKVDQ